MSLFVPSTIYNSLIDTVDKNNYMNTIDRQNNSRESDANV